MRDGEQREGGKGNYAKRKLKEKLIEEGKKPEVFLLPLFPLTLLHSLGCRVASLLLLDRESGRKWKE